MLKIPFILLSLLLSTPSFAAYKSFTVIVTLQESHPYTGEKNLRQMNGVLAFDATRMDHCGILIDEIELKCSFILLWINPNSDAIKYYGLAVQALPLMKNWLQSPNFKAPAVVKKRLHVDYDSFHDQVVRLGQQSLEFNATGGTQYLLSIDTP